jgi:hypothetical protein
MGAADLYHVLPLGGTAGFTVSAIGSVLALSLQGPVHGHLDAAVGAHMEDTVPPACWLPQWRSWLVCLLLVLVLVVNVGGLASIVLSRCGHAFPHNERLHGFTWLASPRVINLWWIGSSATFVVQACALPFYAGLFMLLLLLSKVCRRDGGTCAADLAKEARHQLPGLDVERYCSSGLDDSEPVRFFLFAVIMTVLGQATMASSLNAEWERLSEELHYYQEHDGTGDQPDGAGDQPDDSSDYAVA